VGRELGPGMDGVRQYPSFREVIVALVSKTWDHPAVEGRARAVARGVLKSWRSTPRNLVHGYERLRFMTANRSSDPEGQIWAAVAANSGAVDSVFYLRDGKTLAKSRTMKKTFISGVTLFPGSQDKD
jgi:hypothetical protein